MQPIYLLEQDFKFLHVTKPGILNVSFPDQETNDGLKAMDGGLMPLGGGESTSKKYSVT